MEDKEYLDREKVKHMICTAIDNIPDCAGIIDVWVDHFIYLLKLQLKLISKLKMKPETIR